MSDSSFEIPSRAPSLERRNRLLFGICLMLFLAAAFLATSLWLRVEEARKSAVHEKRIMGRLLVDQVMLIKHWTALEEKGEFRPFLDDLTESLSNQKYTWGVIRLASPDGLGAPRDEFEREVLAHFLKAKPPAMGGVEFRDRFMSDRNVYQYYQPIRARQSCLAVCHRETPEDPATDLADGKPDSNVTASSGTAPVGEGDLMAVVEITFPYAPAR